MTDSIVLASQKLPPGRTAETLFGREAPLILEIGIGGGEFLAGLAAEEPERTYLGCDLSRPSVYRAFRKVRRAAPERVRLYHGDGRFLVRDVLAPGSLRGIHVNFPDPWPKEEHTDRRLLRAPFFREAAARLTSGGWIELTTDHTEYFRRAVEGAEASGWFEVVERPPSERALRTRYAEKWREAERSIHCARFKKRSDPPTVHPSITLIDMQHSVLEGTLPSPDDFEKLVRVREEDEETVIVLDALKVTGREKMLFTVRTEERYLVQEFLVEARQKEKDRVVLGAERFAGPLPTEAVGRAVEMLTEWLEEAGLTVRNRSY